MVIMYNDRQLAEICAFCANKTAGSVLSVDKTYNLGRFYVTVTVYRNLALQRNGTQITPSFTGPIFSTVTHTLKLTACFLDTCLHVCPVVVSQTSVSVLTKSKQFAKRHYTAFPVRLLWRVQGTSRRTSAAMPRK